MEKKWYLSTWFIALMFALWPLIFPPVIGILLLIKRYPYDRERNQKYGKIDELDSNISNLESRLSELKSQVSNNEEAIKAGEAEVSKLAKEIKDLSSDAIRANYNFASFEGLTSQECKNQLALLKSSENELIKNGKAVTITSSAGTKSSQNAKVKKILRVFSAECENILLNLTFANVDTSRGKITKSFDTINKLYESDGVQINKKLLDFKLKELNLVFTYENKKIEEKEIQKAIKEQMIEEEKVRREIEREKAKIEKDQNQFNAEINRLMGYMQKSGSDVEKQLYTDKIRELEEKIKKLEEDKKNVLDREANARAGYVYVISNIGSFGDDIYKIGMTRRLEPMDRIDELSSASVPFEFDVHAMIFSEDAPALESMLHQAFDDRRVNMVNTRKEFFHVSLKEIEELVKSRFSSTTKFTEVPVAREYNETLRIIKEKALNNA